MKARTMTATPKRPPGRPRKAGAPTPEPGLTAEGYLEKVVSGVLPADPSRVRAALGLIRFQTKPKRAPLPAPSGTALEDAATRETERTDRTEFQEKASAIRARHAKKGAA
jgi:hypothetical protein